MAQSDYLNRIQVATRQKYQLKQDEQILKESFRRRLEDIFQSAVVAKYPSTTVDEIRLKCYGSLNNGFGLANCDMDLLLSLPNELDLINNAAIAGPDTQSDVLVDIASTPTQPPAPTSESDDDKFEVALLIEGALLDLGIGARLLTKTRVPILRVCERPGEELLANLRAYRAESLEAVEAAKEKSRDQTAETPPELSVSEISTALQEISSQDAASQIGLPDSPPKTKQPSLEFTGDCGIECDVNFTNSVALHNTRLLREYCMYDSRVAEVGTFVKAWVKIRDINTPYWGTLSSYGYVLMVLHYLMNVAQPPVIPNLQDLACSEGSWDPTPVEKFEGKYDIRFWSDSAKIQAYKAAQPRNRESTGHLLRGFFWYYSAREGFNFKNDIISIRARGGILKKFHKGWTEAKWADQKKNVRQRYLLAIEDPFEVDHNVARVVGHNGIVAIRDEFRRAWTLISSIGGPEESVENLLDPVEARGDLLRKDQEHHREKIRKMKQELEAKEKQVLKEAADEAEKNNAVEDDGNKQDTGTLSHRIESPSSKPSHRRRSPDPQLTQDVGNSQVKRRQPKRGRVRKIKQDSGSEDENAGITESGRRKSDKSVTPSRRVISVNMDSGGVDILGDDESDLEPYFSPSELCRSQGFDTEGNPVAWDVSTQDGRWLEWRDNKIHAGTWKGIFNNANLSEHDARYPFDPRRPKATMSLDYKLANEFFYVDRAPFPMNKIPEITSTESAISAGIPMRQRGKPRRSRRAVRRDSSSSPAVRNETIPQPRLDAQRGFKDEPNPSDFASEAWPMENDQESTPAHALTHDHNAAFDELPSVTPSAIENDGAWGVDAAAEAEPDDHKSPFADPPTTWATESASIVDQADSLPADSFRDEVPASKTGGPLESWPLDNRDVLELLVHNAELRAYCKAGLQPTDVQLSAYLARECNHLCSSPNETGVMHRIDCHHTALDRVRPPWPQYSLSELPPPTSKAVELVSLFKDNATDPNDCSTKFDSVEEMPDTAFIRCRRLAYFAEKEVQESSDNQTQDLSDTQDITMLMRRAGITRQDISQASRSGDFVQTKTTNLIRSSMSDPGTPTIDPKAEQERQRLCSTFESNSMAGEIGEQHQSDMGSETLKVPLTLLPHVPSQQRPRDEDPNIMPTPRQLGFKFDVRQLRDLSIIREGGNGCAKAGYEFEIEDEHEWTGSGAVEWTGSSARAEVPSETESEGHPSEYGDGDAEILLAELPGPDI